MYKITFEQKPRGSERLGQDMFFPTELSKVWIEDSLGPFK